METKNKVINYLFQPLDHFLFVMSYILLVSACTFLLVRISFLLRRIPNQHSQSKRTLLVIHVHVYISFVVVVINPSMDGGLQ